MIIRTHTQSKLARAAFTLMEMLVVVAIIVALAGIGGYFYLNQAAQAKISTAKTQMKVLEQAVNTFRLNHDQWPPTLQTLLDPTIPGGPYLNDARAIIDPWGNPYLYDPNGTQNAAHGNIGKVDLGTTAGGMAQPIGNWVP